MNETRFLTEEKLLLLWIVARKHGLIYSISALHDDMLMFIPIISDVYERLLKHSFVTSDWILYEATKSGEDFLRKGVEC